MNQAQPSSAQNPLVVSQLIQSTSHQWWLLRPNLVQHLITSQTFSPIIPPSLLSCHSVYSAHRAHQACCYIKAFALLSWSFIWTTYSHPSRPQTYLLSSQLFAHVLLA